MAGEDDNNDEVIVSLPADTSTVTITKATEKEPEKKPVPGPNDDPVDDLKSQFAVMQRRATEAENTAHQATRHAAEVTQRLHKAEGQVVDSQLDTILSGIAAAQAEVSAAEQAYAIAFEAGDGAAIARATRQMTTSGTRLQRLEEAKGDIEDGIKARPKPGAEPQQQPRQPQRSADPVEEFTKGMSSRSAAWVKAHPECVTDEKKYKKMMAAHAVALADDIEVDSDEYFRRIEEQVGAKKTDAKPADGRRPAAPSASGAGAGGALNGGGVEVRLTKGEAASAQDGTIIWNYPDPTGQNRWKKGEPIGLAEMARRKHEGQKAGLYDKNNIEA
jgi:hypothetical protein